LSTVPRLQCGVAMVTVPFEEAKVLIEWRRGRCRVLLLHRKVDRDVDHGDEDEDAAAAAEEEVEPPGPGLLPRVDADLYCKGSGSAPVVRCSRGTGCAGGRDVRKGTWNCPKLCCGEMWPIPPRSCAVATGFGNAASGGAPSISITPIAGTKLPTGYACTIWAPQLAAAAEPIGPGSNLLKSSPPAMVSTMAVPCARGGAQYAA